MSGMRFPVLGTGFFIPGRSLPHTTRKHFVITIKRWNGWPNEAGWRGAKYWPSLLILCMFLCMSQ